MKVSLVSAVVALMLISPPSPGAPRATKKLKPPAGKTAAAAPPAGAASAPAAASPAPATPPPAGSSPMVELKKSNAALNKALQKKHPAWSPEAEMQKKEVRKLVGAFLDYGELSRRALARHWDGLTPKQRDEFVTTLRDLVERSYLDQVHGNPSYDIKFEKETVDKAPPYEAQVTSTLRTVARGKKVTVALEYKLLYKDGHWVVYDVITDEQSLLENYRAEFNKVITKESFDALLKRMKKNLEEKSQ